MAAFHCTHDQLRCLGRSTATFPISNWHGHISLLLTKNMVAARTVLRRSDLETSVEVDSKEIVDNFEELINRLRELVDLAGGKSEVAPT